MNLIVRVTFRTVPVKHRLSGLKCCHRKHCKKSWPKKNGFKHADENSK